MTRRDLIHYAATGIGAAFLIWAVIWGIGAVAFSLETATP